MKSSSYIVKPIKFGCQNMKNFLNGLASPNENIFNINLNLKLQQGILNKENLTSKNCFQTLKNNSIHKIFN